MVKGGTAKVAAASAKGATGVAVAAAAPSAVAGGSSAASGTIWSGTGLSLGLGLGLGAWGPVLVLGTLGLVAAGVYLYRRNRQLEAEEVEAGGDEAFASA